MGKIELVALLCLSFWWLVIAVWLFFAVPWGCLPFVIVVFPDHTHLLFTILDLWETLVLLKCIFDCQALLRHTACTNSILCYIVYTYKNTHTQISSEWGIVLHKDETMKKRTTIHCYGKNQSAWEQYFRISDWTTILVSPLTSAVTLSAVEKFVTFLLKPSDASRKSIYLSVRLQ